MRAGFLVSTDIFLDRADYRRDDLKFPNLCVERAGRKLRPVNERVRLVGTEPPEHQPKEMCRRPLLHLALSAGLGNSTSGSALRPQPGSRPIGSGGK